MIGAIFHDHLSFDLSFFISPTWRRTFIRGPANLRICRIFCANRLVNMPSPRVLVQRMSWSDTTSSDIGLPNSWHLLRLHFCLLGPDLRLLVLRLGLAPFPCVRTEPFLLLGKISSSALALLVI